MDLPKKLTYSYKGAVTGHLVCLLAAALPPPRVSAALSRLIPAATAINHSRQAPRALLAAM
jgi:hypothetical protein